MDTRNGRSKPTARFGRPKSDRQRIGGAARDRRPTADAYARVLGEHLFGRLQSAGRIPPGVTEGTHELLGDNYGSGGPTLYCVSRVDSRQVIEVLVGMP